MTSFGVGLTCVLTLVYLMQPHTSAFFPNYLEENGAKKAGQVRETLSWKSMETEILSSGKVTDGHKSLPSNTRTKRFPGAIIIGVRKGGTRALINMLKTHPLIVAATNEVHYFDRDVNFAKGVQWYIDQMPFSYDSQITLEKSPSYFVSPVTPRRVYTLSPSQKLILIVRNPVDRTVSDYTQLSAKVGKGHRTFEGEVFLSPSGEVNVGFSPISVSMYDVHFVKWLKYFPLEQILIVDGDMLIKDPVVELKKVEKFLGVDAYFSSDMFYFNATKGFHCWRKTIKNGKLVPNCLGSSKGRQHPKLSDGTEQRLVEFFDPHNRRFFNLIKRKFDWSLHG